MPDQDHDPLQNGLARLHAALMADIRGHVATLRKSCVEFYGYAVLPPNYHTAFDPTTLVVAFNSESDIDANNSGIPYYRYSVDEWQNFVHQGFDSVNRELKSLLMVARKSSDDPIDKSFISSVYKVVLDAMLQLRNENEFHDVPYLVVWLSDSADSILSSSVRLLNSPDIYWEFASEFCE